jgi:hypothetical protein
MGTTSLFMWAEQCVKNKCMHLNLACVYSPLFDSLRALIKAHANDPFASSLHRMRRARKMYLEMSERLRRVDDVTERGERGDVIVIPSLFPDIAALHADIDSFLWVDFCQFDQTAKEEPVRDDSYHSGVTLS